MERYNSIIMTDARIARNEAVAEANTFVHRDLYYMKGYLIDLELDLANPCQHLPYLYMNENCEYISLDYFSCFVVIHHLFGLRYIQIRWTSVRQPSLEF